MSETDQSWYDLRGKNGLYSPGQQTLINTLGAFGELLGARVISGEQGAAAAANRQAERSQSLRDQRFAMFQQMQQQAYQSSEKRKDREHQAAMLEKEYALKTGEDYLAVERGLTATFYADPAKIAVGLGHLPPAQQAALGDNPTPEALAGALRTVPNIQSSISSVQEGRQRLEDQGAAVGLSPGEIAGYKSDTELRDAITGLRREVQQVDTRTGQLDLRFKDIQESFNSGIAVGTPSDRRQSALQAADELSRFQADWLKHGNDYPDILTSTGSHPNETSIGRYDAVGSQIGALRTAIDAAKREQSMAVINAKPIADITPEWEVLTYDADGIPNWSPDRTEVTSQLDTYATSADAQRWNETVRNWTNYTDQELSRAGVDEVTIAMLRDLRKRGEQQGGPVTLRAMLRELFDQNGAGNSSDASNVAESIRSIANLNDPKAVRVVRAAQYSRAQTDTRAAVNQAVSGTRLSMQDILGTDFIEQGDAFFGQGNGVDTIRGEDGGTSYQPNPDAVLSKPEVIDRAFTTLADKHGVMPDYNPADPDASLGAMVTMSQAIGSMPNTALKNGLKTKLAAMQQMFDGEAAEVAEITQGLYTPSVLSSPEQDIYRSSYNATQAGSYATQVYHSVLGTPGTMVNGTMVTETIGDTETITTRSLLDVFGPELNAQFNGWKLSGIARRDGRGNFAPNDRLQKDAESALERVPGMFSSDQPQRVARSSVRNLVDEDRYADREDYEQAFKRAAQLDMVRNLALPPEHPARQLHNALLSMTDEEAHAAFITSPGVDLDLFTMARGAFTPPTRNPGRLSEVSELAGADVAATRKAIVQELADLDRARNSVQNVRAVLLPEGTVSIPMEVDYLPGPGRDVRLVSQGDFDTMNNSFFAPRERTLRAREAILANADTIDQTNDMVFTAVEELFSSDDRTIEGLEAKLDEAYKASQLGRSMMAGLEDGAPGLALPKYTGDIGPSFPDQMAVLFERSGQAAGAVLRKQGVTVDQTTLSREATLASGRVKKEIDDLAEAPWMATIQSSSIPHEGVRSTLEAMKFDEVKMDDENPQGIYTRALMFMTAVRKHGL